MITTTTPSSPLAGRGARDQDDNDKGHNDKGDNDRGACDRTAAVTRSLLGYGVLAGPCYVLIGVIQGLTRHGFDFTRHDLSLLANGSLGWIQIGNLVLSGLMTVVAAIGMRRSTRAGTWGPRLVAGYGIGLVLAGVFVADPMNGFPVGAPPGKPATMSWHSLLHVVAGSVAFLCLIVACFVLARRFGGARAWYSRITGVLFGVSFLGIASGSGSPAIVLGFSAGVLLAWTWLAVTSIHFYRMPPRVSVSVT